MTATKTIALVSAFPPGRQSLNEYGYHLAINLAARADIAKVIVLADILPCDAPELDLGPKIEVRRVWSFNALRTLPRLVGHLRRLRPTGVIFNLHTASFGDRETTAALGLLTPALTRLAGVRSGVIAHNLIAGVDLDSTVLKGQPLRQWLVKTGGALITGALMRASYVTVTLKSYHDYLTQTYPRADVSLVPHGTFDTSAKSVQALEARPMRIVTMGKFGTYKRLETLIAAMRILGGNPAMAGLELVIGGSDHPNTPGYLDAVAQSCTDMPNIRFHGYVAETDVPDFFAAARLSVFDYENTTGSSGVLHQTASYGAVPVFPRIGDFVDVCRDEEIEGVNYRAGDAQSMARAITVTLADLPHAQKISEANRLAALGFPFSRVVDFHVEKLSQATGGARKDARDAHLITGR